VLNTAEWALVDCDCGSGTLWQHGICCIFAASGKTLKFISLQFEKATDGMALTTQAVANDGMHQANKANSAKAVPQERCHFFNTAFCIFFKL
jgi:hypothetical protein